jgi:hypothetical protein
MKPERSLPSLQATATGSYPESEESSPQYHTRSTRSILLFSHLFYGHVFPSSSPFKFFYKNFVRISHLSNVCYNPTYFILLV